MKTFKTISILAILANLLFTYGVKLSENYPGNSLFREKRHHSEGSVGHYPHFHYPYPVPVYPPHSHLPHVPHANMPNISGLFDLIGDLKDRIESLENSKGNNTSPNGAGNPNTTVAPVSANVTTQAPTTSSNNGSETTTLSSTVSGNQTITPRPDNGGNNGNDSCNQNIVINIAFGENHTLIVNTKNGTVVLKNNTNSPLPGMTTIRAPNYHGNEDGSLPDMYATSAPNYHGNEDGSVPNMYANPSDDNSGIKFPANNGYRK